MICDWYHYLLSMLMLSLAIASVIAGVLTAYFGSGKSRIVGVILILLGVFVGVLFIWCSWLLPVLGQPPIQFIGCIQNAVVAVIGGIAGAGIALGLFLLAIMKA